MVKTYGELYRQIKYALEPEEGPQAANTARELLAFVTGKSPAALMAMQTLYASEPVARQYLELAGRVLAGEPLAYILGQWDFYGLHLTVTPDVLIPRDDTMAVVDLALEQRFQMPKNPRILDLCTGSGCIGLALASQLKDARVTLADLSPKALKVAKKNAVDLRLTGRVLPGRRLRPGRQIPGTVRFDHLQSALCDHRGHEDPPAVRPGLRAPYGPGRRRGRPGLLPGHCGKLHIGPETRRLPGIGIRHGPGGRCMSNPGTF